jgi:hypothetical protein
VSVSTPSDSPAIPRPSGCGEYRRLIAAGVSPQVAEVLACHVYARTLARAAADTRRYAAARARRQHHRVNLRPKPCPHCAATVQAGNLARHRRSHPEAA